MFDETLEDIMSTLKLSRSSQPFMTLAVPSSRMFGHKFKGKVFQSRAYWGTNVWVSKNQSGLNTERGIVQKV